MEKMSNNFQATQDSVIENLVVTPLPFRISVLTVEEGVLKQEVTVRCTYIWREDLYETVDEKLLDTTIVPSTGDPSLYVTSTFHLHKLEFTLLSIR